MTATRWRAAVGSLRWAWTGIAPIPARVTLWSAAFLGGLLGLLSVIGWSTGTPYLAKLLPRVPEARFNTSLAIVLVALAWFLPRALRMLTASLALLVGVLTLFERISNNDLGIDQLFVSCADGPHPGQMSVLAAAACALLGLIHMLLICDYSWAAQLLAALVLVLGLLLILGYVYDVSAFGNVHSVSRVATTSATSFVLLSIAGLAAVPNGSLGWAVSGQDAGAQLVRRLLPLTVVGLPSLGFLCVLGQRAGWFSGDATSALIVIACGVAVAVFTWFAARKLSRVDRRRAQAIADLTELRIDLERQAQERAQQLQRRHNEIAVLEDRQRIAADLHDIVIQRLFAAGMYLQSGAQDADPATRRRLDDAVETMDIAIKDLRASIFELGGPSQHPIDITTAISDVCSESARVLGFEPDVLIDDPDEDADALREDVLAVLREALANVARHAEASSVDVVLRVGDGTLWLTITDDGLGISGQPHRSGTRNMQLRAREFGGECTWTRLQPHGTRVMWRVPVGEPTPAG